MDMHIRINYTTLTEPFETLNGNKKNSSFQVVSRSYEATLAVNIGVSYHFASAINEKSPKMDSNASQNILHASPSQFHMQAMHDVITGR